MTNLCSGIGQRKYRCTFSGLATIAFGVDIGLLTLYHGEHAADEFELDGIHHTPVAFALTALALIVVSELRIVDDGTVGCLRKGSFQLVVTFLADMVA